MSIACGVVGLHGCLLEAAWPAASWHGSTPALEIRLLTPPATVDAPPVQAFATLPSRTTAVAHLQRFGSARAPLVETLEVEDHPSGAAPQLVDASPHVVQTTYTASTPSPGAPEAVGDGVDVATPIPSVPTYRTVLPPAALLSYDLKHGMFTGDGEISWQPANGSYDLKLQGRVASLTLLTQISHGGFDAAGVAPVRYTDQRLRRGVNAANLQRAAGKITFSGPSTEYPLLLGTQDRVSWMVQLAGIVNADPALSTPGAAVTLFVVGARGEGDVWTFRCVGPESVDTGLGPMAAVKFNRDPTKPHDTQVEAWLAPRLHGLPAHARLSNGTDGALDLVLRAVQAPP